MRITVTWQRDENDSPEQFLQTRIIAIAEGSAEPFFTAEFPPFQFNTKVRRFFVPEVRLPAAVHIPASLLSFRSQIRRDVDTDWMMQQE
jgi:hypothetical protein